MAQTIRYWHAVELFSPQSIPGEDPHHQKVADARAGEPLPWEPGSYLEQFALRPNQEWRHTVYGGLFDIFRVHQALVDVFGEDPDAAAEHPARGQSAVYSCTVDSRGLLVENTAVLAACAWAVGRTVRPGPEKSTWLDGFVDDALAYADGLGTAGGSPVAIGARLLSESLRTAIPGAVGDATKIAVTGALGGLAAPVSTFVADFASGTAANLAKALTGQGSQSADAGSPQDRPAQLDLRVLTAGALLRFTKDLAEQLHIDQSLAPQGLRIRSYPVVIEDEEAPSGPDEDDVAFLNSFYASDLLTVGGAVNRGDLGPGLASYLQSADEADRGRTDVRVHWRRVLELLGPERVPPGRWVGALDQPLAFSQQFAVNQIMATLASGAGLFAVNGPPGTGKTTMLRDLVADVVVQRAMRIADLERPGDAFDRSRQFVWPVESRKFPHKITAPLADLAGFEMVVASANNAAVANVTMEIPGGQSVAPYWRDWAAEVDYFRDTARGVFGADAWAMIAAKLGNRGNRGKFAELFWWGSAGARPEPGRQPPGGGQWAGERSRGRSGAPEPGSIGMNQVLGDLEGAQVDWPGEVAVFRAAVAEVRRLAEERAAVEQWIARSAEFRDRVSRAQGALQAARAHHTDISAAFPEAEQRLGRHRAEHRAAHEAFTAYQLTKPGFLSSLSTLGRQRRDWDLRNGELHRATLDAGQARSTAEEQLHRLARERDTAESIRRAAEAELAAARRDAEGQQAWLDGLPQRWEGRIPVGPRYEEAQEDRETSSPWADEEFTEARTDLFLAALSLHKAFITAQARTIRQNLSALMAVFKGRDGRPSDAAVVAAWQTLFLVVPVVSTTFASFDRLFTGFGRESLGWVLIDEAGQATAQQAVGAIWRARRTVVVGDPLQIEPVVTLPYSGQRALMRQFGVAQEWAPSLTSVQAVADRSAPFGTALPAPGGGPERVWVGAPLRVHRRCDRPMFNICNEIAYDGLMVYGTGDRSDRLPGNTWFDTRSSTARGHWIPAEGQTLSDLLTSLAEEQVAIKDVRVLSPFKQIADESRKIYRRFCPELTDEQLRERAGTVHTMQGREADIVILVLGTAPQRSGSRNWASQRPNLLNVAVSRARRRLYVIGNHQSWREHQHFDVLARDTPSTTRPPREIFTGLKPMPSLAATTATTTAPAAFASSAAGPAIRPAGAGARASAAARASAIANLKNMKNVQNATNASNVNSMTGLGGSTVPMAPYPGAVLDGRLYLDVPFAEKDQAKKLGAQWDRAHKLWHVDATTPRGLVDRWLPAELD